MTAAPAQPVPPYSGPAIVELVELTGISASFTPLELEGLVRTAAEAVYGDDDDLSTRQRELASHAHALMAEEAEDAMAQRPGGDGGLPLSGYARMLAIKDQLNIQALAVEEEFTALLRGLFPRAAYMVLHIEEDDSFTLRRAVTAQGRRCTCSTTPATPRPRSRRNWRAPGATSRRSSSTWTRSSAN